MQSENKILFERGKTVALYKNNGVHAPFLVSIVADAISPQPAQYFAENVVL